MIYETVYNRCLFFCEFNQILNDERKKEDILEWLKKKKGICLSNNLKN